jgi:hypothetical protein
VIIEFEATVILSHPTDNDRRLTGRDHVQAPGM